MASDYDIFIIGGGINGCGIARDAVGRGYSVALCEQHDLASGTSSASTKLVHGGLRYLEHYEFRLVREALTEREVLWAMAPHIIWPMRFILPHHRKLRPAWLLRLGLFLYDHIGGRKKLPPAKTVDLTTDETGNPIKSEFRKGFEYSDCWVDDARLVVVNARDAADRGAKILTRTECIKAVRKDDHWVIALLDHVIGETKEVTADLLVNAGGPWVDKVITGPAGDTEAHNVRLVQGSHIVVPKLFNHNRAYIFQNEDERIIFAIPYEQNYTLIGTTDHDFEGQLSSIKITDEEVSYLCNAASEYFNKPIVEEDVVWTYSGVRPLYDDGASKAQEATRDYVLRDEGGEDQAKLINIFGGKITTYRRLSQSVLELIEKHLGSRGADWTAKAALPGGDFPVDGVHRLEMSILEKYPFLALDTVARFARTYGTLTFEMLGETKGLAQMGQVFGADLTTCEVSYLMEKEWAVTSEDVLWRRTKLGLQMTKEQIALLESWMQERRQAA